MNDQYINPKTYSLWYPIKKSLPKGPSLSLKIRDWVETLDKRLIHVHLSDCDGTIDNHKALGQGSIPWQQVLPIVINEKIERKFVLELSKVEEHIQSLKMLHDLGFINNLSS